MDRYVVIGNPVAHSRSPEIHAAFARQSVQVMNYERLECPVDGFGRALEAFANAGGRGCNITVPFKFEAFRLVDSHTPRAAEAGACNTLRRENGRWIGDNTDGAGLLRDIERNAKVALQGRRILLIGAGGAAAGVLGPLLRARPSLLTIANRTETRAVELLQHHPAARAAAESLELRTRPLDDCGRGYDIVVNASASSLADAPVPVSDAVLGSRCLAVDLMYGPAARRFVDWAERHGAIGRDGLGMLVEQAAETFEWFRGIAPATEPVLAALRREVDGVDR